MASIGHGANLLGKVRAKDRGLLRASLKVKVRPRVSVPVIGSRLGREK